MPKRPSMVQLAALALVVALPTACGVSQTEATADKPAAKKKQDDDRSVHVCNICGKSGKFDAIIDRADASCPKCQSRERHRLLVHYLETETQLPHAKLDVLHFSPMNGERKALRKWKNLNYKTADYEPKKQDLQLDLTDLKLPDESWDVLIVYHILEHIIDDAKAMREMVRVLRPGGMAVLQVPIEEGRTEIYEDATIVDPKEREKAFGQWDHVRKYSEKGLKERLEAAGFVVEIVDHLAKLDPAVVELHSLRSKSKQRFDERIWLAKKPPRADAAPSGQPASAPTTGQPAPTTGQPAPAPTPGQPAPTTGQPAPAPTPGQPASAPAKPAPKPAP